MQNLSRSVLSQVSGKAQIHILDHLSEVLSSFYFLLLQWICRASYSAEKGTALLFSLTSCLQVYDLRKLVGSQGSKAIHFMSTYVALDPDEVWYNVVQEHLEYLNIWHV